MCEHICNLCGRHSLRPLFLQVSWTTIAMAYERAGIKKVAAMAWERAGPHGARQKVPPQEAVLVEIDEMANAMAQAIESSVGSAQ